MDHRSKVFNDPIHGLIQLSHLSCKIIDTPIFQRLRDISQLGGCYYVFPAAASRRFEHSLGVAYLARYFVNHLKSRQPELNLTEVDCLCVELAGLIHDLGHGPFSHLWDGRFLPHMGTGLGFDHEHASIALFDLLVEKYNLEPDFASHGLTANDRHFVKELVLGGPKGAPKGFQWRGRPGKEFLFDIVANKRNGIDVDKFDYFSRDALVLGINKSFDALRLIRFARVERVARSTPELGGAVLTEQPKPKRAPSSSVPNSPIQRANSDAGHWPRRAAIFRDAEPETGTEAVSSSSSFPSSSGTATATATAGLLNAAAVVSQDYAVPLGFEDDPNGEDNTATISQLEVCFAIKESWNCYELFHTRFTLHKRAYQHRVSNAVELMMVDALVLADPHLLVPGSSGLVRMSRAHEDMEAYWKITEHVLRSIEFSTHSHPDMQAARAVIEALRRRQLYCHVCELLLAPEMAQKVYQIGAQNLSNVLTSMLYDKDGGDGGSKSCSGSSSSSSSSSSTSNSSSNSSSTGSSSRNGSPALSNELSLGDSPPIKRSRKKTDYTLAKVFPSNTSNQLLQQQQQLPRRGVICQLVRMGYGKGNRNPLDNSTTFYKSKDESTVVVGIAAPEMVSRLIPQEFQETTLRIFTRAAADVDTVRVCFNGWADANLFQAQREQLTPVKTVKTT
jgi:HD superfamily phosphohydrolase